MGLRLRKYKEELVHPSMWLDEPLENDEVDLEEWAFWKGYYEDEA